MKLRKLMAMAAALCLCGAMVGCGDSGNTDSSSKKEEAAVSEQSDKSNASEDEQPETEEETEEQKSAGDPSELFKYELFTGEDTVSLPCILDDLCNAGWELKYYKENPDEDYAFHTRSHYPLIKDGIEFDVTLKYDEKTEIHFSEREKYDQLNVSDFTYFSDYTEEQVQLFDGIFVGVSTVEDVMAAYGEPNGTDYESFITYRENENEDREVYFSFENGVLHQLMIRYE